MLKKKKIFNEPDLWYIKSNNEAKLMIKTKWIYAVLLCVLLFPLLSNGNEPKKIKPIKKSHEENYKKDEIFVKYKSSYKEAKKETFREKSGFTKIKTYKKIDTRLIKIPKDMDVQQALEIYRKDPNVEYAEPNYLRHLFMAPNDPRYTYDWGLNNYGQTINNKTGTVDADIDAPEAWDISTGSADVVVAVIDTGIDYYYDDISPNIWTNHGEIEGNGIDDDENLKVDDVHGWDFGDNDNYPLDNHGHGTRVAGIIAAKGNNSRGIPGVAWTTSLMALKVVRADGKIWESYELEAIEYASDNGADIINLSFGGENFSQTEKEKIEAYPSILFVCAAGNGGEDDIGDNNDSTPVYPASYDLPNIISVAATDQNDNLASFSNYGSASVDIGAPGANIYSPMPSSDTVWSDNFDDGDISNWTFGGLNNTWGTIQSTLNPSVYYLAESPAGNYSDNSDFWVTSPPFDLSSRTGVKLSFLFKGTSQIGYDFLYVQASSDGISWFDCTKPINGDIEEMTRYYMDLKNFEGSSSVYIRFRFVSDGSINYDGFYIDDVDVSAASTVALIYSFQDGTSFAAPYVSGAAAVLKAAKSDLSVLDLKNLIMENVDPLPGLNGKCVTGGRLNLFNALQEIQPFLVDHFTWEPISPSQVINSSFGVTLKARNNFGNILSDFNDSVTVSGWASSGYLDVFSDNFEDGDFNGWSSGWWSCTRQVTNQTAAIGNYSFTIIGSSIPYEGVSHTLPNSTPDRVDFYVRSSNTTSDVAYFVVGKGSDAADQAVFFYLGHNGTMQVINATLFPVYNANQWYKISFIFNWNARTFEYYVDDSLIESNIPFRGPNVDKLSVLYLYNYTSSQAWWDEIMFTDKDSAPVNISPEIVTNFANGVWSGNITVLETGADVFLRADDGRGHTGISNTFDVIDSPDSDGDGLPDILEDKYCTYTGDADTDDDGIIDGDEDKNHNGVVDAGETDPCDSDTDNDGIQDGTESGITTGHADTGGTFITDADSGSKTTNPLDSDTDDDGLLDGEEDINHNGSLNTGETDPADSDTDDDGMSDGWEITNELNPLIHDANEDADGDGFKNITEYRRGTDPQDENSYPSRAMPWLPLLLGD